MLKDTDKEKAKRVRRTKIALEKDIMDAAKEVIEEFGFENTTASAIVQRAGIEPNVFYKRFENLGSLFEQFTQRYDYWLSDVMDIDSEHDDYGKFYHEIMMELARSLYRNKSMQKLLIWEVSDNNPITRRTAGLRESHSKILREKLEDIFRDSDIDIDVFTALLVGGIYYVILHRNVSTFCGVDFSSKEGKERFLATIKNVAIKIFENRLPSPGVLEIAKRMKNNGIDGQTISSCTDLPLECISNL